MNLPELPGGNSDIVPDNIRAMAAIYFAAQLEQLKFFQVADRLVELFQSGQLPLQRSSVTDLLRVSTERLDPAERQQLYVRALGLSGGASSDVTPNTEFSDLWLRFITAVGAFGSPTQASDGPGPPVGAQPATEAPAVFRRAALDLATNLSLYGYGWTFAAAQQLTRQVNMAVAILNDPEIQSMYGAHGPWSVVQTVAQSELGGATNTVRLRTLADSGATVIRWLADHATDVAAPASTVVPDTTLLNAVDQWLAVSGISDSEVDQYSQPVECPLTPPS
jgi:hypothetical protein